MKAENLRLVKKNNDEFLKEKSNNDAVTMSIKKMPDDPSKAKQQKTDELLTNKTDNFEKIKESEGENDKDKEIGEVDEEVRQPDETDNEEEDDDEDDDDNDDAREIDEHDDQDE